MNASDDLSLIRQATVSLDRRAFDRLVVKYQAAIRRFFLNQTLGDRPLSDDLAQDTFVKAYVNLAQFKGQSAFSTWLYRIAYNVFYDHTRSRKIAAPIDTPAVERRWTESADPHTRIDLYAALTILTEHERLCITLQLMEGETIERIAEITDMAQGTVKSHLFRGKQKLTNYLKANGYDKR